MTKLSYVDLVIEDKQQLPEGGWYSYAGFSLSEVKKKWGLFNHSLKYGENLMLLVCAKDIKDKPGVAEILPEEFEKRLSLTEYDKEAIESYISKKVAEAAKQPDTIRAFDYLSKFFVIDD